MTNPYQAYVAGMTMSIPPEIFYLPMAAQNITAGLLCVVIAGNVTIMTTSNGNAAGQARCVAVQSVDNSGGTLGSQNIGVVMARQRVTVTTDTALERGDYVKGSTTTAGHVEKFVAGTDDPDLIVGKYLTEESAVFARSATTPYTETLSGGQIPLLNAASGDIVIIELQELG